MRKLIYLICLMVFLLDILCIRQLRTQEKEQVAREPAEQETMKSNPDKWFAWDKFLHFTASAGITGLSYHFYHCQFNNPETNSIYFSISIAGASGIGKEFMDKNYRKTGWSWKDIIVDGTGIVAGYLLFIKLKK